MLGVNSSVEPMERNRWMVTAIKGDHYQIRDRFTVSWFYLNHPQVFSHLFDIMEWMIEQQEMNYTVAHIPEPYSSEEHECDGTSYMPYAL